MQSAELMVRFKSGLVLLVVKCLSFRRKLQLPTVLLEGAMTAKSWLLRGSHS